MKIKKIRIEAYYDGVIYKTYDSIMDAVKELNISFPSIEKSIRTGAIIKGYRFKLPVFV